MAQKRYKVVATSNHGHDSYAEKEVVAPILTEMQADAICEILNQGADDLTRTYYAPKTDDYVLWRGMEEFV